MAREFPFIEGFDCYTSLAQRWDEWWGVFLNGSWHNADPIIDEDGGRHGTGCLKRWGSPGYPFGYNGTAGVLRTRFDNKAVWMVGVAVYLSSLGGSGNYLDRSVLMLNCSSGGTGGVGLCTLSTGNVAIYEYVDGARTVLAQSRPGIVYPNVWNYFEIKVNFSTGDVQVQLNGNPSLVIDEAALITGGTTCSQLLIGNSKSGGQFCDHEQWYDDLYVEYGDAGDTGDINFKGDCRVCTLMPTGVGTNTDWTPSTGANWECVNEKPGNETDYVTATDPGDKDTYQHEPLPPDVDADAVIYAVAVSPLAKKDAAGVCQLAPTVLSNGSNADGPTFYPITSYVYYTGVFEKNPDGDIDWTKATVNAMEFGQKVIS